MDNKIEPKPTITIDDFHKLDIKIGHILSAEKIAKNVFIDVFI